MKLIKVLIVDDDPSIVAVLEQILTKHQGFDCESVSTLGLALARCKINGINKIDVIILDLGLSDSLGFEGLEKLLDEYPIIPIIILTGHDNESDSIRALQMGAQAYITKPFKNIDEILNAIPTAIARQGNVNRIRTEIEMLRNETSRKINNVEEVQVRQTTKTKWTTVAIIATIVYELVKVLFG